MSVVPPFIDDLLADSSFAVRLIPGLPSGSHDAAAGSGSLPRVPVEPVAVPQQPSVVAGGDALGTYVATTGRGSRT